jgi:hypothetical protein
MRDNAKWTGRGRREQVGSEINRIERGQKEKGKEK